MSRPAPPAPVRPTSRSLRSRPGSTVCRSSRSPAYRRREPPQLSGRNSRSDSATRRDRRRGRHPISRRHRPVRRTRRGRGRGCALSCAARGCSALRRVRPATSRQPGQAGSTLAQACNSVSSPFFGCMRPSDSTTRSPSGDAEPVGNRPSGMSIPFGMTAIGWRSPNARSSAYSWPLVAWMQAARRMTGPCSSFQNTRFFARENASAGGLNMPRGETTNGLPAAAAAHPACRFGDSHKPWS